MASVCGRRSFSAAAGGSAGASQAPAKPLEDEDGNVIVEETAEEVGEEEWEDNEENTTLFSMKDADKDEEMDGDALQAKNPRYELQPHVRPMDQFYIREIVRIG